jgi:hypothetical protein
LLENTEQWKNKFAELERFSKNEIDRLQQENDEDTNQLETQIIRLEKVLQ